MARAKATDFLHNFRFHVVVQGFGEGSEAKLGTGSESGTVPSAGFSSVSIPEASHDAVEYREGHFIYTQKYVGLPTIGDVSLQRGVALGDGGFWEWMKDVIEGNAEYRATVSIFHYHRDSKPETSSTPGNPITKMGTLTGPNDPGIIEYRCLNAFPIRYKFSSDLDATASEVSIQELDLAVEAVDKIPHAAAP